jgi:hypothetical protein
LEPGPLTVYVVRRAAEPSQFNHLVGIFCAATIGDLADVVDEWFIADELEAAPLPAGGIYWPHDTNFPVPNRLTAEAAEEHCGLPAHATLTSAWDALFYGMREVRAWFPIPVQPS